MMNVKIPRTIILPDVLIEKTLSILDEIESKNVDKEEKGDR